MVNLEFGTGDSPMRRWRRWHFTWYAQEPASQLAEKKQMSKDTSQIAASPNTLVSLDCREVLKVLNQFLSKIHRQFEHPSTSAMDKKIVLDEGGYILRQRL